MNRPTSLHKATGAVVSFVKKRVDLARGGGRSAGASAVEWVIISAIVAALVAGIGFAISTALNDKTDTVKECIASADGSGKC